MPGCKRLHLTFSPSGAVKSLGRAKIQIVTAVVVSAGQWLRTPRELQPSQGAQTAPHSRGLGGWPSWAQEFVARQPVAAFRSPIVCGSLAFARRLRDPHVRSRPRQSPLTLAAPSRWRLPTHPGRPTHQTPPVLTALILGPAPKLPGCKRLHLSFSPSQAGKSPGRSQTQILSGTGDPGRVRLRYPSRDYRADPRSRPETARLQALASGL